MNRESGTGFSRQSPKKKTSLERDINYYNKNILPLIKRRDLLAAESQLRLLIQAKTKLDLVYSNLAAVLIDLKREQEALIYVKEALRYNPKEATSLINLGIIYAKKNEVNLARKSFESAIKITPNRPDLLENYSGFLAATGETDYAYALVKKLLSLAPGSDEGWATLYICLTDMDQHIQAKEAITKSLNLNPKSAKNLSYLAALVREEGDIEKAEMIQQQALDLDPKCAISYSNMALIYQELDQPQKAYELMNQALELDSESAQSYMNMSIILFNLNRREEGYKLAEWRRKLRKPYLPYIIPKTIPLLETKDSIHSKLTLIAEQGLGDSIQFGRYAQWIAKKYNCRIDLHVQAKLVDIIAHSLDGIKVLSCEGGLDEGSSHYLPLLSCPFVFGEEIDDGQLHTPYLKVRRMEKNKWEELLMSNRKGKTLIGITWQGNPEAEKQNQKGRSIKLETLKPIAELPGVEFVSLQKGYGSDQLENCSFRQKFSDQQQIISETMEFMDMAAIMECCDYIITTDTANAHLAGSIGVKTYLLLKKNPDWRWSPAGERTFWYPTIQLIRQQQKNDWPTTVQTLKGFLE